MLRYPAGLRDVRRPAEIRPSAVTEPARPATAGSRCVTVSVTSGTPGGQRTYVDDR
jgi:hypothetical protein